MERNRRLMLEMRKIKKNYISKSKTKTEALKNVSLIFKKTGMNLIFGASGSGKTTLLNIIGGLDNDYEGEMFCANKLLKTKKDLESYRRNYIGFIFQDYNLINDLTIKQNLSLGFQFSKQNKENKIEEILTKVGLRGYENRYPNELSGGEQQRITIARALLKNCKILIADEPTGNLDKKNGQEIYELLKEISKEKLVIVVSHDEDLGTKYADRIVKLENGIVVFDNLQNESIQYEGKYIDNKERVISNKIGLKLALSQLKYKKVRSIVTILLMVICYCVVSFTIAIFQFHPADVHYHLIKKQNYQYIRLEGIDYYSCQSYKEKGIKLIMDGYASSKAELEQMGFRFYQTDKKVSFDKDSQFISDELLREMFNCGSTAYINGEEVKLNYEDYSFTDLIGNKLWDNGYIIAGIFYSPRPTSNYKNQNDTFEDYVKFYENTFCDRFYYLDDYSRYTDKGDVEIAVNSHGRKILISENFDFKNNFDIGELLLNENGDLIELQNDKNVDSYSKDKEIYVSTQVYNTIFGTNYTPSYFIDVDRINGKYQFRVSTIPVHLGESIDLEFYNIKHKKYDKIENLKIKGLVFSNSEIINPNLVDDFCDDFFLSKDINNEICRLVGRYDFIVKVDSVKNLQKFLHQVINTYEFSSTIDTPVESVRAKYTLTDFKNDLWNTITDIIIIHSNDNCYFIYDRGSYIRPCDC